MPNGDEARWLAPVSAFAAVALGRALQIANGELHPDAVFWLSVTLVLVFGAIVARRSGRLAAFDLKVLPTMAGAGVLLQVVQMYYTTPGVELRDSPTLTAVIHLGPITFGAIGLALVVGPSPRMQRWLLGAFLAIHVAMGTTIIRHSPKSIIDVDVFHRQSIGALRSGVNPYAITFPNIYGDSQRYGADVSTPGRLLFGFPYPPTTLLLSLPGTLLARDHRYAALVAMQLAAVLMMLAQPRGFGVFASLIYLTSPRIFYVLQLSWTEPFVVLGLAAVVFAACRDSRAVPWLFGAFLGLKQYLVFALPAAWLIVVSSRDRRGVLGWLARAAVIPTALTMPFVLWGPTAFVKSVVTLQFHQPFRPDSLSLLSWWASIGHPQLSSAIAFGVAALAAALAVWRCPRTAAGFSAAVALTFLAFFAFNKQAFCNYYFFVIGALCVTLAACATPTTSSRG